MEVNFTEPSPSVRLPCNSYTCLDLLEWQGNMAFSIMAHNIMAFSVMIPNNEAFNTKTNSITTVKMTLGNTTFSIMTLNTRHSA